MALLRVFFDKRSGKAERIEQFIAEHGIEYGLQIVTQKFLNAPDCLYIKKSCKFLQSYEKSRAKQKNLLFFLPRRSKFAISDGKITKKNSEKSDIVRKAEKTGPQNNNAP